MSRVIRLSPAQKLAIADELLAAHAPREGHHTAREQAVGFFRPIPRTEERIAHEDETVPHYLRPRGGGGHGKKHGMRPPTDPVAGRGMAAPLRDTGRRAGTAPREEEEWDGRLTEQEEFDMGQRVLRTMRGVR